MIRKILEFLSIGSIFVALLSAPLRNVWITGTCVVVSIISFIIYSFAYPNESGFGSDEDWDDK